MLLRFSPTQQRSPEASFYALTGDLPLELEQVKRERDQLVIRVWLLCFPGSVLNDVIKNIYLSENSGFVLIGQQSGVVFLTHELQVFRTECTVPVFGCIQWRQTVIAASASVTRSTQLTSDLVTVQCV